jgi:CcmD family protein
MPISGHASFARLPVGTDRSARSTPRAPAVSSGEKYVAAAYLVVFVGVLGWIAIIATKLARLQREVAELVELARGRRDAA